MVDEVQLALLFVPAKHVACVTPFGTWTVTDVLLIASRSQPLPVTSQ